MRANHSLPKGPTWQRSQRSSTRSCVDWKNGHPLMTDPAAPDRSPEEERAQLQALVVHQDDLLDLLWLEINDLRSSQGSALRMQYTVLEHQVTIDDVDGLTHERDSVQTVDGSRHQIHRVTKGPLGTGQVVGMLISPLSGDGDGL